MGSAARNRQSGQVLWLALLLLMVLVVALMFVVASGRLFAEKTRLVSAADQAALGAAIWRARVLNFDAYANRALLAQDVAIAQALTLVSWARYFEQLSAQTAAWLQDPGALGAVSSAINEPVLGWLSDPATLTGARQSRQLAEEAAALEVWLRSAPEVGYRDLLMANQALLHQSASVFGLGAVANEVARATDPRYFAFVMSDHGEFTALTEPQSSADDRRRYVQWLSDVLDPFVRGPRSASLALLMPDPCEPGSNNIRLELLKRGVTVLSNQLEQWLALDDASVHLRPSVPMTTAGGVLATTLCSGSERLALGWGAAGTYVSRQIPSNRLAGVDDNPVAFRRALDQLVEQSLQASSQPGVMTTVRDLTQHWRDASDPVTSPLAVLARIDRQRLRLTHAADASGGGMRLHTDLPGSRLWALSAAQVYFRKPGMPTEAAERASLFSPYWQARLVEPSASQRNEAQRYVY